MKNHIVQEDILQIVSSDLPWERMKGKSVLVTGANGFLPSYLIETLLLLNTQKNLDIRIFGLVRNRDKALVRFGEQVSSGRLKLLVQDVSDPINIDSELNFIIHAASQASPKYFGNDPVGTLKANVLGTYNVLELARKKRTESVLFFSAGEIYGNVDTFPTTETDYGSVDPMQVRSCYAESKRLGETMCVSWHQQYEVPVKIVRPFHTYGPGVALDDGRVFADFVSDILAKRNIILKSAGAAIRSFCYLADATAGYFTVLLKGEDGQAYNISNDSCEISIRELAEILVSLFPELNLQVEFQKEKRQKGYLESMISRNCPDISKVRALGWNPKILINEGFKRTIKSFYETERY